MVTYFPSQTSSNLMKVIFVQTFWLGIRKSLIIICPASNFFEVICLNVETFCAFELRLEVTNIFVTRDKILHQKRIYLQKNESFIFKYSVKAPRNSPIDCTSCANDNTSKHSWKCLKAQLAIYRVFKTDIQSIARLV